MPQTYTRKHLDYLTNGAPKVLTASATTGDLLHTATAEPGEIDEVFLEFLNNSASAVIVTLEVDTGSAVTMATVSVAARSAASPTGVRLNLAGGVILRAFAATPASIFVNGYVNRIAQS